MALAFDDHGPMVLVAENKSVVFLYGETGIDADAYHSNFRTRAMCRGVGNHQPEHLPGILTVRQAPFGDDADAVALTGFYLVLPVEGGSLFSTQVSPRLALLKALVARVTRFACRRLSPKQRQSLTKCCGPESLD